MSIINIINIINNYLQINYSIIILKFKTGKHYKSQDGELVRARENIRQSAANFNMATRNEILHQNLSCFLLIFNHTTFKIC